jgi:predicted NUDIX family phosphoesterase
VIASKSHLADKSFCNSLGFDPSMKAESVYVADEKGQEAVLVVPRDLLDSVCPQTFCRETARVESAVLANPRFISRDVAEHDFEYKQVIPYVVIRHQERYLLIQRTTEQTETRLHNMYSLGIGGHVNSHDASEESCNAIISGMRRELDEEIRVDAEESCTLIGVVNDDSTEVARLHLGFVYLLTTTSPRYTVVEQDHYTATWKLPDEITHYYNEMESWAQIVHDYVLFSGSPDRAQRWDVRR